jgi:predicted transcriptional regulator
VTGLPLLDWPAHQRHSPTSAAAAIAIEPAAGTLRRRVLEVIRSKPSTDEEIADLLALNPSTSRPRRIELVQAGLVVDSGTTRKTRSGRQAVVWSVA